MAPAVPSFIRSSIGRGFIIFALLCGVMSVGVGVASYYSTLEWFKVNKGEEKITAVQLVDAFVDHYTKMRAQYLKQEAPVPATFRAQAIARFNESRDKANALRLIWVGPTGREIATAPSDKEMASVIDGFTKEAKPKPVTHFVSVGNALLFRTVYPSIASQQSCVTCHNQMQAGKPNKPQWHLNDVMGASVLDVPAGPFLSKARHDAVATGLAVFLFSMAIGLITFYLQYREFARRAASEASLRLAHLEIRELNAVLERRVEERTAELRDAQEALLRKERLATLGQLTATVSHELRNPLGVIRNTFYSIAEAVKKGGLGLDRQFGRIDRNILRCNTIITKMLDYTRTRALEAAPRAFDAWLSEILDEYEMPPGIALHRELGAPGIEVEFDPGRLQQVFVNLLDNARDAIVEARGEAQPGAGSTDSITVRTAAAAHRLEIQVRDTGGGVPEEVLPKIFEPLFSTKGFGVGLGLPTVKQIVEQHGGTIAISSEAGKGATVKVSLPLTQVREIAA